MGNFFITSSGTGIGKTLVTAVLCWQLKQQGKSVTALKPVISGFDYSDLESDSAIILKSGGITVSRAAMEAISPWRFAAPLAPSMAAAQEDKPQIELDVVLEFCRTHARLKSDFVLVEGAGGVMSPLNHRHTMLDVMEALAWPTIVVGGSYLGAISHTLTALEALQARRVKVAALVLSESDRSTVSLQDTADALEKFIPAHIPVVKLPRLHGKDELWRLAPPLSWICQP